MEGEVRVRTFRSGAAMVAVALTVAGASAQGPLRTAVIQGTVVSSAGGATIGGALVVVARVGGTVADYRTVEADDAGRFVVRDLAPGNYRLYAERDGYFRGELGRRLLTGAGTPLALLEGQSPPPIVIALTPPGVIAGRVVDRGKPAPRVWVRALKPTYFDGQRSFRISAWTETDDRGEYRLFGLEPGSYVVSAMPQWKARIEGETQVTPVIPSSANDNRRSTVVPLAVETLDPDVFDRNVYPAVYHPGTTDIGQALPIDVAPGTASIANDLLLARALPRAVRGRVTLEHAEAPAPPALRIGLLPAADGTNISVPTKETKTGEFEFARVPPGRYYLSAQTVASTAPRVGGVTEIDVGDRDVTGVVVPVAAAVAVSGQVTIDGRPLAATDPRVSVQLLAGPGITGTSALPVPAGGAFTITNVTPGTYRLRVIQAGRTPWVKALRFGAEDVTNTPFRVDGMSGRELAIEISTATGVIEAAVVDEQRRPIVGALVVAVPDAARRGRSSSFRSATTDGQGRIRLADVAPGEYRLFATTDIEAAAWQDPAVIRRFDSRGEVVKLPERGSVAAALRIVR